jgi:hypothetical protein
LRFFRGTFSKNWSSWEESMSAGKKLRLKLLGEGGLDRGSSDLLDRKPPSVERLIDEVLEEQIEDRPNFFRPSMLWGCNRSNYFHYMNAPFHPQRQAPRMKRILDEGTAIHKVVQGYLADHPEWFFAPEARVRRRIKRALVRGSTDGVLIRRTDGYRFGIEIKSKKNSLFVKLTKPESGHVSQATTYGRILGVKWVVIVYWNKDNQAIKEYPVRVDLPTWRETRRRIAYLHGFVQRKEIPKFDPKTCDVSFCSFQDHCRKKGAPV